MEYPRYGISISYPSNASDPTRRLFFFHSVFLLAAGFSPPHLSVPSSHRNRSCPHPRSSDPYSLRRNRSCLHPSSRRRSSGDAPGAALPRAFLRRPPPCLPPSPALVLPCNTLRRRTLRHPAPPAAIGGLPVGDPRATPAKGCAAGPPPDPASGPQSRDSGPPRRPSDEARSCRTPSPLAVRRGPTPPATCSLWTSARRPLSCEVPPPAPQFLASLSPGGVSLVRRGYCSPHLADPLAIRRW